MSKIRLSFFVFFLTIHTGISFAGQGNTDCNLTGFITYTQGGWGSPSNSVPGQILDTYFPQDFTGGLIAGLKPEEFYLQLTSAQAVRDFLPQGGTSGAFITNYYNPSNTSAGVLGGQLVAAILNVGLDQAGHLGNNTEFTLGGLVIANGPFQGLSVNEFLVIANKAAAGQSTGFTYSEINSALNSFNSNFDNGTVNKGFLGCPPPPASLGDRVWFDTNRNGIQDEGEEGVLGVTVNLYNCSNVFLKTTTTATNGFYIFENLSAGDYYVEFILPQNYAISPKDQGADNETDSDVDPVTGKTVCTNLTTNENDMSWDAGIYTTYASLGDRVWYDNNKDGIQDQNENGVSGVVVKLLDCQDNVLTTTATNQNGYYLFNNLVPGQYHVQFILPQNYVLTLKDQGGNDALDSDADENGFTVCTELVADEQDLCWDAGIYQTGQEADLSLVKDCDNPNPLDGDIIHFSVIVTNHGPAEATNVKVIDIVPQNAVYKSFSATQGSYDAATGIWEVGTLPDGTSATLTVALQVQLQQSQNLIDLGPAKTFNVFVLYDVNQPSADTQGKMAVGQDAYLTNYSIGDQLPNSNGAVDVLVVGRNLNFGTGAVYGGNIVYGSSTNLPVPGVSIVHGILKQGTPIDFAAARNYLQSLSDLLEGYAVNGTTDFAWGTVTLTGTDPQLNVFSVDGNVLSQANNVEINTPAGAVVLVNISGTSITWKGGLVVNGTDFNNVLYNFTDSGNLNLFGIDVLGTILAPYTDVNFQAGVQHGQLICRSLTGSGQFNLAFFMGHIPGEGRIVNISEVYFADQYDPDSTPNNGIDTEDDYGKAIAQVGNPPIETNWQYISSFISSELVLTITNDTKGNIYAGTLGGKIYKSTDNGVSWTRINESMNAVYIWNILIDGNGNLFAGTELGLYKSVDGTTWALTTLSDKDIRTIVMDNSGNLYAGAWGYGVYKSTDNGNTWSVKNNGLGSIAIHTLFFNNSGELFAGAYDFGMFKTNDGAENWISVNIPYQIIWSSAKTSGGVLFVGTYGGGLFKSVDNGTSWQKITNLAATDIYHIVVDAEDNIYVCSWTGGVFASADLGTTWNGLGMPGTRITSLLINPATSTLIAGTEDGKIYTVTSASSTEETGSQIPDQFNLLQNYPNPFNPSTVVKFEIPVYGDYSVKMFNVLGQEVKLIASGSYKPGRYTIIVNASGLSSGVYFYTLTGKNVSISKKMMLLK